MSRWWRLRTSSPSHSLRPTSASVQSLLLYLDEGFVGDLKNIITVSQNEDFDEHYERELVSSFTRSGCVVSESGNREEGFERIMTADLSLLEPSDELKQKYISRIPKAVQAGGFIWPGMVVTYEKILSVADMDLGEDDFLICTYPKSGTTWASEVVSAIVHEGNMEVLKTIRMDERVPWLELDFAALAADCPLQTSSAPKFAAAKKRVFFTHLHPQFLPKSVLNGKCKLLYVARNPKDTAVSFFHFHHMAVFLKNEIDLSWDEFFPLFCQGFLASGSWFKHAVSYWKLAQTHKNVKFVRYEDMKKDLLKAVEEIENFVGVPLTPDQRIEVRDHCTFKSMKDNKMTNRDDLQLFDGHSSKFMRKGIVGDWKNYFTVAQNEAFEEHYKRELEGSGLSFEFK